MKNNIKVGERVYNPNELEDAKQLETVLLPSEWPIEPREGVKLFLAIEQIAAHALSRHLASNFKKIVKIGMEQIAENPEENTVKIGFSFAINFQALAVAAVGGIKMSFSQAFSSTSRPVAEDINQTELELETLDQQMDPAPPEPEQGETPKEDAAGEADNLTPPETSGDADTQQTDDTKPEPQPNKRKRVAKKPKGKKK